METSHQIREKTASRAFEALGQNPSDNLVLMVQSPHSHHLAAIYDTAAGHVYHSVLHAVSHGRKDYEDLGQRHLRMAALFEHQFAEMDYRIKRQAKLFWDFLARMRALRTAR